MTGLLSATAWGWSALGAPDAGRPGPRAAAPAELRALAERPAASWRARRPRRSPAGRPSTFGDRFCVTSSMADAVLAHLVSRVAPGVDVVFLDTGLHFPETLRVRDEVARTMPVNVRSIRPRLTVGQQDGEYGPRLFDRDPGRLLPAAQGGAAGAGPGRLRRLGRRAAPGRVADPGEHAGGDVRRPTRQGQGQPDRGLVPGRRGRLHRPLRRAGQRAVQPGLRLDRLLAVHPPDQGRARTRGPAAGRCSRRPSAVCTSDRAGSRSGGRRGSRHAGHGLSGAAEAARPGSGRWCWSRTAAGTCGRRRRPGRWPVPWRPPGRARRCCRVGWTTPSRGRRRCCAGWPPPVTAGRCWCRCC